MAAMEEDLQEEHKDLVVPPVTEIPQSHLGNPTEIYHEAEGFMSDDEDSDIPTKSPPTPDPMAGIGYWESPGNSPKLIRNKVVQGLDGGSKRSFIPFFGRSEKGLAHSLMEWIK